MLADGLTKPLAPVLTPRFLTMLGLVTNTHRSIRRSACLAMTSSDIIVESGITPHDLIACSAMTSYDMVAERSQTWSMTSPVTSFRSISGDIRKPLYLKSIQLAHLLYLARICTLCQPKSHKLRSIAPTTFETMVTPLAQAAPPA